MNQSRAEPMCPRSDYGDFKVRACGHCTLVWVIGLGMSAPVCAEGPSGEVLVNTCFSCHGTDGHSAGAMPSIAGKDPDYIERRLIDYREDRLQGTVMNRIAKGFSDAEIMRLARYFAAQ